MRASFYTFGCKLNQFETEALASAFKRQGFAVVPADQDAELYIINTCTVTSKSEQKARRLIRKLSRRQASSLIIITGCYAQLNSDSLLALGHNIVVVPQDKKEALLEFPGFLKAEAGLPENKVDCFNRFYSTAERLPGGKFRFQVDRYSFHSRAFLKIQDGCDYGCAYCRIPLARGRSVSLDPQEVISRILKLERSGYREAVLTGVNITAYRYGQTALPDLLKGILKQSVGLRFRLSSLEPEMIDQDLIGVLRHKRICPHFHIPVQSGSDKILGKMRRRYTAEKVVSAVNLLRKARPEAFIGADIIAGLPGETDQDFLLTRRLIENLRFSSLHIFPFSPRPGTRAETFEGRIPERIRDGRVQDLCALSRDLYRDYVKSWQGKRVEAVLELSPETAGRQDTPEEPLWRGLSGNYLKIMISGVPGFAAQPGRIVSVQIDSVGDLCIGRCICEA